MTITQLEYIIALDTYRNFVNAAESCNVTQPTLSMQIQKLEDELGVKVFDRSKQPVIPTSIGEVIITQARNVLKEHSKIVELIQDEKGIIRGFLRLGIIPTIAPYLIPRFLIKFLTKYPDVNLIINELTTEQIIYQLKNDLIDCGIMASPIKDKNLTEETMYFEEFVTYVSPSNKLAKKTTVKPEDLDIADIWILNEGHCMRNQVINICGERKKDSFKARFNYQTGSVETLKRIVDQDDGITILPELAILEFGPEQIDNVRYFKSPEPVREISMFTHRNFVKKKLVKTLMDEVIANVPNKMRKKDKRDVVKIH
ncbi:MAG: hydrogen peroxide-inducible genes activator [Bacteroidetes bacterium]|nr:hydrogen peroxide-inducible genes activator [Bacteroidota bacterium]